MISEKEWASGDLHARLLAEWENGDWTLVDLLKAVTDLIIIDDMNDPSQTAARLTRDLKRAITGYEDMS